MSIVDKKFLDKLCDDGYLYNNKHPIMNLWIYSYTDKIHPVLSVKELIDTCNGLVIDENGKVIAKPFRRFYNIDTMNKKIPLEPYIVTEKVDGNMVIVTRHNRELVVCSRCSFNDEVSNTARSLMLKNYDQKIIEHGYTYIFELVSPKLRNIIDYGFSETLYLITIIKTVNGVEIPYDNIASNSRYKSLVPKVTVDKDFFELAKLNYDNKEGLVIHFTGKSDLRCSIIYDNYTRIVNLLDNTSVKDIWEVLRTKQSVDDIIEDTSEDFYNWYISNVSILCKKFITLESEIMSKYTAHKNGSTENYEHQLAFGKLDRNESIDDYVWSVLEPKAEEFEQFEF